MAVKAGRAKSRPRDSWRISSKYSIGRIGLAPPALVREDGQSKSDITRESILRAGAIVFSVDGYSNARLTDVAGLIGMKAGSLYYHFDSREALVEAILERGMRHTHSSLEAALASLPPDADPLVKLKAAIECHFMAVVEQEEFALASVKLMNQIPEELRQKHLANLRAYAVLWRALLNEARAAKVIRADLDLSVVRMTIIGALNFATDWFRPGKLSAREVARQMSSSLLEGIRATDAIDKPVFGDKAKKAAAA